MKKETKFDDNKCALCEGKLQSKFDKEYFRCTKCGQEGNKETFDTWEKRIRKKNKNKKTCNLCGWECPEDDMKIRKERHEEGRHTKHTVISERDGSKSKPMGNFIYGEVEWI